MTQRRPMPWIDMDGVQASFSKSWAAYENVNHWKDIPDSEASIQRLVSQGPDFIENFFATLEPMEGGLRLIKWFHDNNIGFGVLSSPIMQEEKACIRGKKTWLTNHNPGAEAIVFTNEKYRYATASGQPDILIDDHVGQIEKWEAAGGIGILYRCEAVDEIIERLAKLYQV